eukprot:11224386-Alexandrium_andersonii.AAC.1
MYCSAPTRLERSGAVSRAPTPAPSPRGLPPHRTFPRIASSAEEGGEAVAPPRGERRRRRGGSRSKPLQTGWSVARH